MSVYDFFTFHVRDTLWETMSSSLPTVLFSPRAGPPQSSSPPLPVSPAWPSSLGEPVLLSRLRGGELARGDGFWSSHQTLSHLHSRQALYSVTPEIRWCTFFFYKEGWKCRCGIGIGVATANHWSYGSIWRRTPWTLGPLSSGAGRLLSTCNIFFSLFCPIWNNNMKHFPVRLCMRAVVPVSHARGKALSVWHSCSSSRINSPLPKPTYALVLYSHSACVQSCCL